MMDSGVVVPLHPSCSYHNPLSPKSIHGIETDAQLRQWTDKWSTSAILSTTPSASTPSATCAGPMASSVPVAQRNPSSKTAVMTPNPLANATSATDVKSGLTTSRELSSPVIISHCALGSFASTSWV